MSLLVLGADGYLGWALTCHLAAVLREPIIAVDDLSKRRRVAELGFGSAVSILPFMERLEELRNATSRTDIAGVVAPVAECIETLVREHRPRAVVHLAQIPSAPYSMRSFRTAYETLANNEGANLAVLFALRDHAPGCHLVKMGSMGEYAQCGVPLAEGYVEAVLDGCPAARPVPFPREADDVYHVSKINDTNYISMACRVWGLAATDVMQSIAYGLHSPFSRAFPKLTTRFDCDPVFGSVVNRFTAQAILGVPLTVHAGGVASTGLIPMEEVVRALTHWIEDPARAGEHRVINHATETRIRIAEIAELVKRIGSELGLAVDQGTEHDPRCEGVRKGVGGPALNQRLRQTGIPSIRLEDGIRQLMIDLMSQAECLHAAALPPTVHWRTGEIPAEPAAPPAAPVQERLHHPSYALEAGG